MIGVVIVQTVRAERARGREGERGGKTGDDSLTEGKKNSPLFGGFEICQFSQIHVSHPPPECDSKSGILFVATAREIMRCETASNKHLQALKKSRGGDDHCAY